MYEGRLQNEEKKFAEIENRLKNMPQFATEWYLYLRSSGDTAGTCYDYIYKLYKFLNYISDDVSKVELSDITSLVVQKYFVSIQTKVDCKGNRINTSYSYQNGIWCFLNNFFKYFVEEEKIDRNYVMNIKKPSARKDLDRIDGNRVLLTEKDFKKILDAVNNEKKAFEKIRNKAIMMVFMNTGMRRTALTCLTLDDIDLKKNCLSVIDKGSKVQVYCLNDVLKEAINDWLVIREKAVEGKNENHLFVTTKGRAISVDCVMNIVKKYTKEALGKPLSPHKLRSGVASIMYSKTKDIRFVQKYIGHSDISTTQRYIVSSKKERKQGAEIMENLLA